MEYLTIEETAKKLKVGYMTIYRLVRKDKIPAIKVGRQWRIPESVVEEGSGQNNFWQRVNQM